LLPNNNDNPSVNAEHTKVTKFKQEKRLSKGEIRYHQLFDSMTKMFEDVGTIFFNMKLTYDEFGSQLTVFFLKLTLLLNDYYIKIETN
jgi:hypothetical protein